MDHRFSLGIDLGTSNSAIALSEVDSEQTDVIELTQVLGPNRIGEKPTLPSALYIPHPDEFPEGTFPLPWQTAGGGGAAERRRGIGEVQHDFGARCGDAAEIERSFGPASEASRKKNPQSRAQVEIFR